MRLQFLKKPLFPKMLLISKLLRSRVNPKLHLMFNPKLHYKPLHQPTQEQNLFNHKQVLLVK